MDWPLSIQTIGSNRESKMAATQQQFCAKASISSQVLTYWQSGFGQKWHFMAVTGPLAAKQSQSINGPIFNN